MDDSSKSEAATSAPEIDVKERVRRASKSRRENEKVEFKKLVQMLPLPEDISMQLDRASVIRLAATYIKLKSFPPIRENGNTAINQAQEFIGKIMLEGFRGFVFIVNPDGKIIYVSNEVEKHLGFSQIDLMGCRIYDYIHPNDHKDMMAALTVTSAELPRPGCANHYECNRCFVLRLKCVLSKRNAGLTFDGCKVIHCSGYLKVSHEGVVGLIAMGQTFPSISGCTKISLKRDVFTFFTGMDLKLSSMDNRITEVFGYERQFLYRKSLYHLVHPQDQNMLCSSHRQLLRKGQAITTYYRILHKDGGWVWIQSYMSTVTNSRTSFNNTIAAVNHVLHRKQNGCIINNHLRNNKSTMQDCKLAEAGPSEPNQSSMPYIPQEISTERTPLPNIHSINASVAIPNINPMSTAFQCSSKENVVTVAKRYPSSNPLGIFSQTHARLNTPSLSRQVTIATPHTYSLLNPTNVKGRGICQSSTSTNMKSSIPFPNPIAQDKLNLSPRIFPYTQTLTSQPQASTHNSLDINFMTHQMPDMTSIQTDNQPLTQFNVSSLPRESMVALPHTNSLPNPLRVKRRRIYQSSIATTAESCISASNPITQSKRNLHPRTFAHTSTSTLEPQPATYNSLDANYTPYQIPKFTSIQANNQPPSRWSQNFQGHPNSSSSASNETYPVFLLNLDAGFHQTSERQQHDEDVYYPNGNRIQSVPQTIQVQQFNVNCFTFNPSQFVQET